MEVKKYSELMARLRRFLKKEPENPDPYARVRVPLKKGPRDRYAAVGSKSRGISAFRRVR